MNYEQYRECIQALPYGKIFPEAVYLHKSAVETLPDELWTFVCAKIEELDLGDFEYDVLKFFSRDFGLSLLAYPDFWYDPYPELKKSFLIDFVRDQYRIITFEDSQNPPILHMLETFIATPPRTYQNWPRTT